MAKETKKIKNQEDEPKKTKKGRRAGKTSEEITKKGSSNSKSAEKNKTTATKSENHAEAKTDTEKAEGTTLEKDNVSKKSSKSKKPVLKYLVVLLILVGIGALVYNYKEYIVAATVNGRPITRLEVLSEAENQVGSQALETLITEQLILQEAAKQNINISEQEVEAEINEIRQNLEQLGTTLEQELERQNTTLETAKEQIRLQLVVEKMLENEIQVTDDEVNAFIEQTPNAKPEDMSEEEFKAQVREQIKQQKFAQALPQKLDDLQNNNDVVRFVTY